MVQPVGYFKLWRELLTKPIWTESTAEQKVILITLLAMANFNGREWEWQGKQFKADKGQFVTSIDRISREAGVTHQNVRTALKRFEKYEFLTNQSTKTGRLISIVNWSTYQQDKDTPNKPANKDLTKTSQRPNRQLTPREEGKEGKEGKKEDLYIKIQHLTITNDEHKKLTEEFGELPVKEIYEAMENYSKLKNYKSGYLTARKWLKKRQDEKPKGGAKIEQFVPGGATGFRRA